MYAIGQLTEEYDLFWDQEFNGYHGLKSMEAITRISMNGMCGQKLTQTELQHYYTLMSRVCPIVKDEICFQLLSMVIMFDTTAMSEDDSISFYWDDNSNQSLNSLETAGSTSSSGAINSPWLSISDVNTNNAGSGNMAHNESVPEPNTTRHNGFGEIKVLQRHYIYLLRRRCMLLKGPLSRRLGDPDGMKNIMNSFKLLAQYVPALM